MLSRTADNLFWAARYMERADFTSRVIDAAIRLSALPASYGGGDGAEWRVALETSDTSTAFDPTDGGVVHDRAATGREESEHEIRCWLAFDLDNPSSIRSCLETARANSRAVRTALTGETWEGINGAWNELQSMEPNALDAEGFQRFLEWTMRVSLAFDGSAGRTMLRNDAYDFLRLGTALERADNTARLLDTKYHLLLPEREPVGGGLDYFQWTTILREDSALTAYRWVYREEIRPWLVADLLLLNKQLPRSVAASYEVITHSLDALSEQYGRSGASQRLAVEILHRLERSRMEELFQKGLHQFIEQTLADNGRLGRVIADQYLS